MPLANLLCEICKDFAEKELRRYSYSDCALLPAALHAAQGASI